MAEITETARARVTRLVANWDWPEPVILEDILALGAEAVPAIAERLTPEFFAKVRTDDPENTQVFYFVQLLGETGDPAAIPFLFNLYGEIDEEDDLLEDIPDALEKLGPQAVGPLLRVAADDSLGWFPRVSAAEAAKNVASAHAALQAQVGEGLRAILTGYLTQTVPPDDDTRDVIASVCADLANLADAEARPLIEAAFDAGIVGHAPTGQWATDIPIIDRDGVAKLYAGGGQTKFRVPRPFLERYRRDYQQHEENQASDARLKALEAEMPPLPVVLSPRIGRNDPCWCGSGKKYKKCHLAQDEKEKSRL